jgi:hypothetical protein
VSNVNSPVTFTATITQSLHPTALPLPPAQSYSTMARRL